jgi:hypothetical protein
MMPPTPTRISATVKILPHGERGWTSQKADGRHGHDGHIEGIRDCPALDQDIAERADDERDRQHQQRRC